MPQELGLESRPRLGTITGWAVTECQPSLRQSLCQRQVRWWQHFNCHASFPASFATELHQQDCRYFYLLLYLPRHFGYVKLFWSYRIKAFSRVGITNTCASRPISASTLRARQSGNPHQFQTWRLCRMIGGVIMEINSPN